MHIRRDGQRHHQDLHREWLTRRFTSRVLRPVLRRQHIDQPSQLDLQLHRRENITVAGALLNQGGTIRVPAGSTVTLSYSGGEVAGQIVVFLLNGSELSGSSFTMPDADATVSTSVPDFWGIAGSANGSKTHPYVITTTAGLDLLAQHVNGGTHYFGKYFVLGADIAYDPNALDDNGENYTAIGKRAHSFQGTFDGQGYIISGIRINKTGNSIADDDQGLFGCIRDGVVKNVTLVDANITGQDYIGGIVGLANYCTIENCLVIRTSIYYGNNNAGVIVGSSGDNLLTLRNNYYSDCYLAYRNSQDGSSLEIGTNFGDILSDDGAVPALHNDNANTNALTMLANASRNNTLDVGYGPGKYRLQIADRTLYKNGDWNTLCQPFDVVLADSPLAGAEARTFSSTSYAGGELTLNFSEPVETLTAGTPYIIRCEKAEGYVSGDSYTWDIRDPLFENVSIDCTARNVETANVTFTGTYDLLYFTADNPSILFLGKGSTLYYPRPGAYIDAFRAYFELGNGLTAADINPNNVKMFFGDEGPTDGVGEVQGSKFKVQGEDTCYDLDGRRLSGKPTQKGIYVNNGRKVVMK